MLKITYKEYLKYKELNIKNNNYNQVQEESAEYTYDINNEHDKVFRDVLSIKEEALSLIIYKAYDALEQKELEEMINKMKNIKEENIMTLGERIRRNEREERIKVRNEAIKEGREEGIKEGIKEGMKEVINKTIKKMILLKLDENIIKEVTGVKDKELEKVKKELQEA